MQAADAAGYPTVRAHSHSAEGLVLDRASGPTMLQDLTGHPARMRRHARTLAELHRLLGAIQAPSGLSSPLGAGTSLLHLDLHPDNVLLTGNGPVVIDWANAAKGPAGADIATTWLLLAAAAPPPSGHLTQTVVTAGRRLFLGAFLSAVDRKAATPYLSAVYELRQLDPNMTGAELDRMAAVVRRHGTAPS